MSFTTNFQRVFCIRSRDSTVDDAVYELPIDYEAAQLPPERRLNSVTSAFKKLVICSQPRSDSLCSSNSTDSCLEECIYPEPDNNDTLRNKYKLKGVRTVVGINKGWEVYDAEEIKDNKNKASVFIFDKTAVVGPDREDIIINIKNGIMFMQSLPLSPYFLSVQHELVEGQSTMAFATEPVRACLGDSFSSDSQSTSKGKQSKDKEVARKLEEVEISFGVQQLIDGLMFLHFQKKVAFLNLCPSNIIITKRGVWKLFGFEFAKNVVMKPDSFDVSKATASVPPWSYKTNPFAQSELNYIAPEVIMRGECYISSDIFSLAFIIIYIYNKGKPLWEVKDLPLQFIKNIRFLEEYLNVCNEIPKHLRDIIKRMMIRDPTARPCTQGLARFCENVEVDNALITKEHRPIVEALQFVEELGTKSDELKHQFFEIQLLNALPKIPMELQWSLVWPALVEEMWRPEPLKSIMKPLTMISIKTSPSEFKKYVIPLAVRLINDTSNKSRDYFLERFGSLVAPNHHNVINKYLVPHLAPGFKNFYHVIRKSTVIISIALSECLQDDLAILTKVYLDMLLILENMCVIELTVLIFMFFGITLKSMKNNSMMRRFMSYLLRFTRRHPALFHHEILTYTLTMFNESNRATLMYMYGRELEIIEMTVGKDNFDVFFCLVQNLIHTIKRYQVIIVTLVDDTTDDNLTEKSKLRQRRDSNISEWIFFAGRKLSITTLPSRRGSVSEMAPTTSESSRPECITKNYKHKFLCRFGNGNYMNRNGNKYPLLPLSQIKDPVQNLFDSTNTMFWFTYLHNINNPQTPP